MKRIILCGLPGCGKTTTGRELAKITSAKMVDLDFLIEKKYEEFAGEHLTCRQIFCQKGESFFRELEKQVIASLAETTCEDEIIAAGGGAMGFPENVQIFKSIGLIVYIRVQSKTSFDRITKDALPSYLDPKDPLGSFEKIIQKRVPNYLNAADLIIEADHLSPTEVASQIIEKTKRVLEKP